MHLFLYFIKRYGTLIYMKPRLSIYEVVDSGLDLSPSRPLPSPPAPCLLPSFSERRALYKIFLFFLTHFLTIILPSPSSRPSSPSFPLTSLLPPSHLPLQPQHLPPNSYPVRPSYILKGKRNAYPLWFLFVSKMYCCTWICVWNVKYSLSYLDKFWYMSWQTNHVCDAC